METPIPKGGNHFFTVIRTTISNNKDLEIGEILPQYSLQSQRQGPATVVGGNDYAHCRPGSGHSTTRNLILPEQNALLTASVLVLQIMILGLQPATTEI